MTMQYVLSDKFKDTHENPFTEETKLWHIWIDIKTTHDSERFLDIDKMCSYHGMNPEYYIDGLEELREKKYLDIIYNFN